MIFLGLNTIFLTHFAAADPRRCRGERVARFDIRGLRLSLHPSSKSGHSFPQAARAVTGKLHLDMRLDILLAHEKGLPAQPPDP